MLIAFPTPSWDCLDTCRDWNALLIQPCALPLQTYLTPPRVLTLEDVIGYVAGDELIEVTPKSIRLRKQILESNLRKSGKKRAVG